MSRNSIRHPSPPSIAWPLLAGLAAATLSACGVDYAMDGVAPGGFAERHPVVLAEAPTTLEVYPVGGGLDRAAVARIRSFAERYRALGVGRITILAPAGQVDKHGRIVGEIRRALASTGLRGFVGVGLYPAGDPTRAAPVRLVFEGLKAEVATPCGVWPDDLASGGSIQGWKNDEYANFGCATQATLAAQVDDPRDLSQARGLEPADVEMRMRAIDAVREGKDPGTDWKTKLTKIGEVGTGD